MLEKNMTILLEESSYEDRAAVKRKGWLFIAKEKFGFNVNMPINLDEVSTYSYV